MREWANGARDGKEAKQGQDIKQSLKKVILAQSYQEYLETV